jgi:hypothetical protein
VLAEAKQLFAELKIPADKAQALVNLQAKVEQDRAAQWARDVETLTHASRTDKEFGGRNWADTETKLAKVRNLCGVRFNDAMQAYGAGNDPEVIRGLLKLHDAAGLSEDRFVSGGKPPSASASAILYPNTPQMRD